MNFGMLTCSIEGFNPEDRGFNLEEFILPEYWSGVPSKATTFNFEECDVPEELFCVPKHPGGRPSGSVSIKEPLAPINRLPIEVYFNLIKEIGYLKAYIVSCVSSYQTGLYQKFDKGTKKVKMWVPSMEIKFPFSDDTLNSNLKWLIDNDFITYWAKGDSRDTMDQGPGYFLTSKAYELCDGVFLKMPAPRKIPKGRLAEYFVLERIRSTSRQDYNPVGTRYMVKCLCMTKRKVIQCLKDLDDAGAIHQEINHRYVKEGWIEISKKARKAEQGE